MQQQKETGEVVMVVIPHPDDAEINTAGTVAKWAEEGKRIIYVVTTNGDKGSSDPQADLQEIARIREKEQLEASKLLGVEETVFMGYSDQCLEDTPDFRKELVRLIRKFRPQKVITVDPFRRYPWHRDHRITGQVLLDAVYPFARDNLSYPDLLKEGLEPHRVQEVFLWGPEDPNYVVDITSTFETKVKALSCHESQVGGGKIEKIKPWLKDRAEKEAEKEEFQLGEAFHRINIWW